MLWALAFACAGLAAIPQSNRPAQAVAVLWAFESPERGGIISSPLVAGERVYVAAIHDSVFSPAGAILGSHPVPSDQPMNCALGDADLASLYVTTAAGELLRARDFGRRRR